jgi:hypothetical protein
MSRENLQRVLDQANDADWQIASQAWYRYRRIVGHIAERHGFPVRIGAAVFAALSPNNDYLGNLRDTGRLLAAAEARIGLADFKVSTYGPNKLKAWRIVHGEDPLDLIVADKTRNFFLNVFDPSDPHPVTVDGHIFNAWTGVRRKLNSADMKGYSKFYETVATHIREIAADRGILPNVVQGGVWYCWKRLHRIKINGQMEFWGPDYMIAGLGFELEDVNDGADGQLCTDGLLNVNQALCS